MSDLLGVLAAALLVPLVLGLLPRLRLPSAVLEIVVGALIGPQVLGWVEVDDVVGVLGTLGLAFLLFLAGLEIDTDALRGPALRSAGLGYAVTLVLGLGAGVLLVLLDWSGSVLLVAVTLSATSLGLVVTVLRDAGAAVGPAGGVALAHAAFADGAAIVLLSLLFSATMDGTAGRLVLLTGFLVAVLAIVRTAGRAAMSRRLGAVLVRLQDTTAQIRVRASVTLLVAVVVLAESSGLESILGAFLAGLVVGLVDRDSSSHPIFRAKLDAIGYGFLVPVFFVSSGMALDLRGLVADPSALIRVPVILALLLVVRATPSILLVRRLGRGPAAGVGLLQATSLPLLITAAQIGSATGLFPPVTAAAVVCAGLLSVLLFPVVAQRALAGPGGRMGDASGATHPSRPDSGGTT